uniref:VOC family protein n=1 Tax=Roseihalotalea indica TaxID=2867963 RepID=A0AA49GP96_9BACT|nr:VOC family protein [Tunicatimonas sp. TK19036]
MRIEHLALWTHDLEALRDFYCCYFKASASPRYHNPAKQFTSYFLSFASGCRLELMHRPELGNPSAEVHIGLAHFALSVGSEEAVDHMTEVLQQAGYPPIDGPRHTGDGYYESTFRDPDGNLIELTV